MEKYSLKAEGEKEKGESTAEVQDEIAEIKESEESAESNENQINYKVMTSEDVNTYKEWVKKKIPEWHEVSPDAVLLTETSSVPFGWLLKNAWKETYPDQKIPKFLRCDIGGEGFRYDRLVNENLIEPEIKQGYLKQRNIKEDDRILVYDESSQKPYLDESVKHHPQHIIIDGNLVEDLYNKTQSHTLERNAEVLFEAGIKNLWTDMGKPEGQGFYLRDYHEQDDPEKKLYVKPTIKEHEGVRFPELTNAQDRYLLFNYTGVLEKDPELRKRALNYIHDLKLAGKEAGIELQKELKETNLSSE